MLTNVVELREMQPLYLKLPEKIERSGRSSAFAGASVTRDQHDYVDEVSLSASETATTRDTAKANTLAMNEQGCVTHDPNESL